LNRGGSFSGCFGFLGAAAGGVAGAAGTGVVGDTGAGGATGLLEEGDVAFGVKGLPAFSGPLSSGGTKSLELLGLGAGYTTGSLTPACFSLTTSSTALAFAASSLAFLALAIASLTAASLDDELPELELGVVERGFSYEGVG